MVLRKKNERKMPRNIKAVNLHEIISFAVKREYGKDFDVTKSGNNTKWNQIVRKIDFDNQALSECGSFDYDKSDLEAEIEEGENEYQNLILLEFMKKHRLKSMTLIWD